MNIFHILLLLIVVGVMVHLLMENSNDIEGLSFTYDFTHCDGDKGKGEEGCKDTNGNFYQYKNLEDWYRYAPKDFISSIPEKYVRPHMREWWNANQLNNFGSTQVVYNPFSIYNDPYSLYRTNYNYLYDNTFGWNRRHHNSRRRHNRSR